MTNTSYTNQHLTMRRLIFVISLDIVVLTYSCSQNSKIDSFKTWRLKCCGRKKSFEFCVLVYLVNGEHVGRKQGHNLIVGSRYTLKID